MFEPPEAYPVISPRNWLAVASTTAGFGKEQFDLFEATQGPSRVSRTEIEDTFAEGWVIGVRRDGRAMKFDPKVINFRNGGPKAWFVVRQENGRVGRITRYTD
ncbi:MAG: hypothetical protein K8U57_31575 [Planctomycetes bacterium]|nr:hypothetical protein [Planctomycetota bacterium]